MQNLQKGDLNIIASALHADTLAIVTGELVRLAGTQLELDAGSLPQAAGVVGCNPGVETNGQGVLVLHGEAEVRVVVVLQLPDVFLLVVCEQPTC